MKPKKVNVLVTSAGSAPAVSVIKALRQQKELDIGIVGIDMDELSAGFYLSDKYYKVNSTSDPAFLKQLQGLCKNEKIFLIIPIIDEELPVFARQKNNFGKTKVLVNDSSTIELAQDKWKTYQFCKDNNILCPRTARMGFDSRANIDFDSSGIIKPLKGRGSQGLYFINDKKQLVNLSINIKEYIWQEKIEGKEYTVDIVASPKGEILQAIPRERIMVKSGQIYKGRTVKNSKLMKLAAKVAKKFAITGPGNIQFIEKNNEFYLIEVNPKFAAGLPLTVNAGVNIPLLLIKMQMSKKLSSEELEFKDNFFMLRYWEEVYFQK